MLRSPFTLITDWDGTRLNTGRSGPFLFTSPWMELWHSGYGALKRAKYSPVRLITLQWDRNRYDPSEMCATGSHADLFSSYQSPRALRSILLSIISWLNTPTLKAKVQRLSSLHLLLDGLMSTGSLLRNLSSNGLHQRFHS